ncbi:uncharacterized protein (DUF1501 family) [Trinickia symbiotica]|uniref:DUF1501 domain-containing protein n=1 Tax=Trinickia symbiotica TaxID=863227 RepID=A0A2N7X0V7_9BURK|nr:DUF1501 domain-containing protein [Trinickia symbiotica]PMS35359.1 DUF1501 domain-containing protein [Trinickia symbiotica]PPK45369.1 uncharacterized protein (DUF1501 family) [Trinickia symbiotica]
MVSRRRFLTVSAAGAGAMLVAPYIAFARAATTRRFVFIIQRGAADGLHIVAPYAEPAYAALRRELTVDVSAARKLDGTFALHPSLQRTAELYAAGQALFVHAVATPYRDRSHFDGQNVLETGGTAPYQFRDGWLNRLVGMLPTSRAQAIAIAPTVPTALRGKSEVTSYAPSGLPGPSDDLLLRVGQLYERDAQLGPLWNAAMATREMGGPTGAKQDPAGIGKLAAGFLARDDGPRIAMIETGGWDTHSAQNGRLAAQLKALDTMLASLRDGLGPVWADTTVLVATEFGRTAAANGTGGTDHGTGSVAMLLGGAVAGGRVVADWPGLRNADLYEGRDLKPTASLDAVIAGAAAETFGLDGHRTAAALFLRKSESKPFEGLVKA